MAFKVFVHPNRGPKGPAIWAYEDLGPSCSIAFGSLVDSQPKTQTKVLGYGAGTEAAKRRGGYEEVGDATMKEIQEAMKAYRDYLNGTPQPQVSTRTVVDILQQAGAMAVVKGLAPWQPPTPVQKQAPTSPLAASYADAMTNWMASA